VGASTTADRQMNAAHVHLMLNHFSIIGSIFGLVLLAVAMVRNSRELTTVSFACLASVAIISIPVYFTGPPAEEAIKHLVGISEEVVERHEEAAQFACRRFSQPARTASNNRADVRSTTTGVYITD